MSYEQHIIHVLAEFQSRVLRPVQAERIKQTIISEYHSGNESTFSDAEFDRALLDGVTSGRFFKVRDSYFLANKKNEAYDPREHQRWLDHEDFGGHQREEWWIIYNTDFGL